MKTVNRSKSDSAGRGENILSESTGTTTTWNSHFLPFSLVVRNEVIIHLRRARNSYMKMLWACSDIWLIHLKRSLPLLSRKQTKQNNNKSETKCQPFWAAKCKSSESPCRELITQRGENHTCRTGQASRPGYTDPPLYVECPLLPTAFLNCWPSPLITCSILNPECPWLRLPPCLLSVRFICG